jgi:hypothetical protein
MLSKIKEFVKVYQDDIILVIGVILISLLSFAAGYIVAGQREKEPLRIEEHEESKNSHYWSGDSRPLFSLETFR